jgi:hypothetical protein
MGGGVMWEKRKRERGIYRERWVHDERKKKWKSII